MNKAAIMLLMVKLKVAFQFKTQVHNEDKEKKGKPFFFYAEI